MDKWAETNSLEHFRQSLPPYLPRQLVLDYILNRVQRNDPNFCDNARCNTEVDFVQFNQTSNKFEIKIHHTTLLGFIQSANLKILTSAKHNRFE